MHGQRDLWRDVNEPLAQQKAHRPGGVTEEPVQLLSRALLTILLTEAQNQLLNLLSAWGTLESKEKAHYHRPSPTGENMKVRAITF